MSIKTINQTYKTFDEFTKEQQQEIHNKYYDYQYMILWLILLTQQKIIKGAKKMKIKREGKCYRPLILKDRALNNIIFYRDGNILYESKQGCLEHDKNDIVEIDINDPKRANEINLNRTDNYYISVNDYGKYYILYIYVDNDSIRLENKNRIIGYNDNKEIRYQYRHDLIINCKVSEPKIIDGEINYIDKAYNQIQVKTGYIRTYLKKLGIEINNLKNEINTLIPNNNLSKYDIEALLGHYDIIKK